MLVHCQKRTSRLEHAVSLAQALAEILQMVQDTPAEDQVKGFVRERKSENVPTNRRKGQRCPPPKPRKRAHADDVAWIGFYADNVRAPLRQSK